MPNGNPGRNIDLRGAFDNIRSSLLRRVLPAGIGVALLSYLLIVLTAVYGCESRQQGVLEGLVKFLPYGDAMLDTAKDIVAPGCTVESDTAASEKRPEGEPSSTSVQVPAPPEDEPPIPSGSFRDCDVCPFLVVVPPGEFLMGSPDGEEDRAPDEWPRHWVTIGAPLAVGETEIAYREWNACVSDDTCDSVEDVDGWGENLRPVVNVSWLDTQDYVKWLSRKTGLQYRLLSEAEWEYAARSGTRGPRYWDKAEPQCRYANGSAPESCFDGYLDRTAPVRSYTPNDFGLHDMLGNVFEWTQDCWNRNYQDAPTNGQAWESGNCNNRMARGGAWNYPAGYLRAAYRVGWPRTSTFHALGFRVVREARADDRSRR